MENWKALFRERFVIEENTEEQYLRKYDHRTIVEELEHFISQELSKTREEGVKEGIHEISKTLDTEITRWRSDEDGEFDVLRIGFRYFRSKDADDYYSSIEAIEEEDFKDYESI